MAVTVLLKFLWRRDKHVNGLAYPDEVHVDLLDEMPTRKIAVFLYHQQIEIAVRPHVAAGGRPEQDDALRLGHLHDPLNDGVENVVVHNTSDLCDRIKNRSSGHGDRALRKQKGVTHRHGPVSHGRPLQPRRATSRAPAPSE